MGDTSERAQRCEERRLQSLSVAAKHPRLMETPLLLQLKFSLGIDRYTFRPVAVKARGGAGGAAASGCADVAV